MRRLIFLTLVVSATSLMRLSAQSTNGLINSFESLADLQEFVTNGTLVSLSTNGVTAGQYSARVIYTHTSWPNIYFPVGTGFTNGDWHNWAGLAVDVLNTNAQAVPMDVRVDDNILADGVNYCQTGSYTVTPGQTGTIYMPFPQSIPSGMNGGPSVLVDPLRMTVYGVPLNWSNIVAFQIFLPQPTNQTVLFFDNLRLVPLPSLTNLADQYGQYTGTNWPDKILQDADFATQNATEQQWLAANPRPADRDTYGGWLTGPQLRASGFFRSAFVVNGQETNAATAPSNQGRWWLVDPVGRAFFSLGVDVVDYGETTLVTGRESLFSWLPLASDPLAAFSEPGSYRTANFYNMNLYRKYGTNWNAMATERVFDRFDSWGLNTLGDWCATNLYSGHRVPYTVPCWYSTTGLATFTSAAQTMFDVFDPAFPGQLSAGIAPTIITWTNDPWCIGYFVDNELPWGGWTQSTADQYALPVGVLGYSGTLPSKGVFASLMQAKYSTVAQLNTAWGTSVASWSSFSNSSITLPGTWTSASITDMSSFLTVFAGQYFSVVSNTVKEFAPNQLYLGCKFASYPPEAVDVAAEYCDVVSFDIYVRTPDTNTWGFTRALNKPCLSAEFQFGALDSGMFSPGLVEATSQADRGVAYQQYLRGILSLPAFVGCQWFQYYDEPLTGRFDGENYNIGFVSGVDSPYWDLVDAARQIHSEVYSTFGPMKLAAVMGTNSVTLSWPFLPGDYVLQWKTSLSTNTPWQTVNGQISQLGAQDVLSIPIGNAAGFFRLIEP